MNLIYNQLDVVIEYFNIHPRKNNWEKGLQTINKYKLKQKEILKSLSKLAHT